LCVWSVDMNIAVTGGIGSGKSRVAEELASMTGAELFSADALCRDLLAVDNVGWLALQDILPAKYFTENRELNRPLLRTAIFTDLKLREELDDLIHPLVRKELKVQLSRARRRKMYLVAEVPLLFEKGWQGDFDCVLVVFAKEEICITRIVQRDFVSEKEALASINAQMDLLEKKKLANFVIENSGSFAETIDQLEYFVEKQLKNP